MTVRLTWDEANVAEQGHRVYRSDTPMDPQDLPAPLADLGPDITTYDDDTAVEGETYFYRVSAYSGSDEKVSSEIQAFAGEDTDETFTGAQVGDAVAGGIYAGVMTYGDNREFHIVAAPASGETTAPWNLIYQTTLNIQDDDDGFQNTEGLLASSVESPAAEHCAYYAGGGRPGWYLPARNELEFVRAALSGHTEFTANTGSGSITWSSTERNNNSAWARRFSNGDESYDIKQQSRLVRPIRRVAAAP